MKIITTIFSVSKLRFFLVIALSLALIDSAVSYERIKKLLIGKPASRWMISTGGIGQDQIRSVISLPDGSYLAVGYKATTDSWYSVAADAWLIKIDATGIVRLDKTYGSEYHDEFVSVQPAVDGGYVLAGNTTGVDGYGRKAWLVKVDDGGNILWQKTYSIGKLTSMRKTDNGYVMVGYSQYSQNSIKSWVTRLDVSGEIIWQRKMEGSDYDKFNSVETTNDGGFIIGGSTDVIGTRIDGLAVKLAGNGDLQWKKAHGTNGPEWFKSIKPTADGGFIAVGGRNYTHTDAWVAKLNSDGSAAWQKSFNHPIHNHDLKSSISTLDGGFLVVGPAITKFSSTGDVGWQRTYGEGSTIFDIKATEDGYVAVGDTWSDTPLDGLLLRFNETGVIPCEFSEVVTYEWTDAVRYSKPVRSNLATVATYAAQTSEFSSWKAGSDYKVLCVKRYRDTLLHQVDTSGMTLCEAHEIYGTSGNGIDTMCALTGIFHPDNDDDENYMAPPVGSGNEDFRYEMSANGDKKNSNDNYLILRRTIKVALIYPYKKKLPEKLFNALIKDVKQMKVDKYLSKGLKKSLLADLSDRKFKKHTVISLIKLLNVLTLKNATPKIPSFKVEKKSMTAFDFNGVAWVSLSNIQNKGRLSLKLSDKLPKVPKGNLIGWPSASYEFKFTGELYGNGYADISIYIGGTQYRSHLESLQLFEWNGSKLKNITTKIDASKGVITGRTNKLGRYVIMSRVKNRTRAIKGSLTKNRCKKKDNSK